MCALFVYLLNKYVRLYMYVNKKKPALPRRFKTKNQWINHSRRWGGTRTHRNPLNLPLSWGWKPARHGGRGPSGELKNAPPPTPRHEGRMKSRKSSQLLT